MQLVPDVWPPGAGQRASGPRCVEVASWRLGRRPVLVEADENKIPICTKDDPPAGGQGRSHDSKLLVAGAAGIKSGKKQKLRRVRLAARVHKRQHRARFDREK